jgi:hypothetical protein
VLLAAPLAILIAPVMGRSQKEQQSAGNRGSMMGAAANQFVEGVEFVAADAAPTNRALVADESPAMETGKVLVKHALYYWLFLA